MVEAESTSSHGSTSPCDPVGKRNFESSLDVKKPQENMHKLLDETLGDPSLTNKANDQDQQMTNITEILADDKDGSLPQESENQKEEEDTEKKRDEDMGEKQVNITEEQCPNSNGRSALNDKVKTNTEEENREDGESEEMMQVAEKTGHNCNEKSASNGHDNVETKSLINGRETPSLQSSSPEKTCSSANAYELLPGVISFEDMNNDDDTEVSLKDLDKLESAATETSPTEMEVDKLQESTESGIIPIPPIGLDSSRESTSVAGMMNEGNSVDNQRVPMAVFGEEESQNESLDEESDGRLFIDTGGESGDAEEEEFSVRRKNPQVESPLAVKELRSQPNRDTPHIAREDLQNTESEPTIETLSRKPLEPNSDNIDIVLSDKEAMLESMDANESQKESEAVLSKSPMEVVQSRGEELPNEGPKLTTTRTPHGAVIKVEQIDEGYGDSQTGDILDILHKAEKTGPKSEQQKRKHEDVSNTNTAEPLSFEPTEVAKRVKKEPVEVLSASSCSSNISSVNVFVSDVSMRSSESVTGTASNSLLQLSKQVDNITSRPARHRVPSVSVASAPYPHQPSSLLRHQLSTGMRFPPRVSRISIPFVRTQQGAGAMVFPATTQFDPVRMKPAISRSFPVSSPPGGTIGKTTTHNQTGIITTQTKNVPSLMNSTSTLRYRLVPHTGGPTVLSTSTTNSGPKPSTAAVSSAATSQSAATSIHDAMPSSSINIDTVGMTTITELIARKNPLPNYKAAPAPEDIKVDSTVFTCYECGDTYRFSTSLETHRGRCSMKISYKCEECKSMKIFFNKCQFLSHLRGHLNIEQTQAVPIHIKSDSISIEPLPKSHQQVFFQKFSVSKKTVIEKANKKCTECGIACSPAEFEKHFFGDKSIDRGNTFGKWKCVHCKLNFPSICAQRAHSRLHRREDLDKRFTCPECGIDQSGLMVGDEQFADFKEKLSHHVLNVCFHLDKTDMISCSKCKTVFSSMSDFKIHHFKKLEQYFKCNICPMAFRQQESFTRHLISQHPNIDNLPQGKKKLDVFKVIFRCHVCDSLIDDRFVLDNHLQQHAVASDVAFKCKDCFETFPSSKELAAHVKAKHAEKAKLKMCQRFCNKTFSTWKELLFHKLHDFHDPPPNTSFHYCSSCGFFYDQAELNGGHLCMSQKTGKVVLKEYLNFCKICKQRKFLTSAKLWTHLESHQNEGCLVCKYCQRTDFKTREAMTTHESVCSLRTVQKQKKYASDSSSSGKKTEKSEKQAMNFETVFACNDCEETFSREADLSDHCKEAHSNLFPCHLCGLTYESQQGLRKHLRVSHEGKANLYPCMNCKKKGITRNFTHKLMLEKHLATKHRISKNQMSSSIINEFAEENEIPNSPPKSLKTTSESKEIVPKTDSPIKRLHVEGDQVFNCAKCRFGCENRSEFLEHLKVHKIDNSVQCLECGLCFAIISSLRKHLFMVHKVKDFEEYCKKEGIVVKEEEEVEEEGSESTSYTSPAEESDQEERDPLECRVCYTTFEDDNKLRIHMRSHGMAFIRNKRRENAVQRSRQFASISSMKSETQSENSNASSTDTK